MPRIKMTKSNIDALPIGKSDVVYWDIGRPGFGLKVTPKGRKVFVVLYRTGGAGLAIAQIHDRALWPCDPPSGPSRGTEGLHGQAGGP